MRVHPTKRSIPTTGNVGGENQTNPENPQWFSQHAGKTIVDDYQQAIDWVIQEQGGRNMAAGSSYDAEQGKRPIRYSIDGQVREGTVVDSDGKAVTSTESTAGMSVADILRTIQQAKASLAPENTGRRSSFAEVFAKYRQIRQIAEQFPNPATAEIDVHRSGILRKPDPRDLAFFEADKANRHLAILESRLVMLIKQYVVTGKLSLMDAIKALLTSNAQYPAYLLPFADELDEFAIELMMEVFKQGGLQLAQFGLEENAQAATYRPRQ
jgi:hypothetical protein